MDAVAKRGAFRLVLDNPAAPRGALLSAAAAVYEARPYSVARQKADFSCLAERDHWALLRKERPKNLQDLVGLLWGERAWYELSWVGNNFPLTQKYIIAQIEAASHFTTKIPFSAIGGLAPIANKWIVERLLEEAIESLFNEPSIGVQRGAIIDTAIMLAARVCENYGPEALLSIWDTESTELLMVDKPELTVEQGLMRNIFIHACPAFAPLAPQDNKKLL
jgi:hypothetical protein